jgi:hypothetical protein
MTAKLMIREVGQREFVSHNGDFNDDDPTLEIFQGPDAVTPVSGVKHALAEGERLCASGNVEAFQVWELRTTRQRVWKLEEVTA